MKIIYYQQVLQCKLSLSIVKIMRFAPLRQSLSLFLLYLYRFTQRHDTDESYDRQNYNNHHIRNILRAAGHTAESCRQQTEMRNRRYAHPGLRTGNKAVSGKSHGDIRPKRPPAHQHVDSDVVLSDSRRPAASHIRLCAGSAT